MLAGAMGMMSREYRLAARFSVDNGASWVLADRDGIANGFSEGQIARLRVSRPLVDWCKLGGELVEPPAVVKVKLGATGKVYSFKPLGDVRPVVDAGGLFNFARQSGMIAAKA